MTVGDRIRDIRKKKKMTQKELAELCGMYDSQIRKYELGSQNPKLESIQKIASALGVNITDLVPELVHIQTYKQSAIHDIDLLIAQLENGSAGEDLSEEQKEIILNNAKKEKSKNIDQLTMLKNMANVSDMKLENLISAFNLLNELGKEKAVEQVELLTKIPDYKKI